MNQDDLTLGESISLSLRRLFWAVVILGLLFAGFAGYVGYNAYKTKAALCALRSDLEVRTAQGEQFLQEHPDGLRGIPAATIQQSLDNQRRTIDVLSVLDCP